MSRKKPQSAMAALLDFSDNTVLTKSEDFEKPRISSQEDQWHDVQSSATIEDTERSTKPWAEQGTQHTMSNQLIEIEPEDCILWRFSDRPSDELGDIESLAQSMKEHGQQEPILVRENRQTSEHRYEIIFGNRRWRAAQVAKIKLTAICKNISDQQAALFQKEENENRKELSDYARAMSYRAQIDGGVFKNESELSKELGISKQALNDLMAYLRVPETLREAISNYKSLSKKMVTKLAALSKNRDMLDVLIILAPKISDQSITTSTLDKHIHSFLSPGVKKNKFLQRALEKRDASGQLLFKTTLQNSGDIALQVSKQAIDVNQMELFHMKFADFLNTFKNNVF